MGTGHRPPARWKAAFAQWLGSLGNPGNACPSALLSPIHGPFQPYVFLGQMLIVVVINLLYTY